MTPDTSSPLNLIAELRTNLESQELRRAKNVLLHAGIGDLRIASLEADLLEAKRQKRDKAEHLTGIARLEFKGELSAVLVGLSQKIVSNGGLFDPQEAKELLVLAGQLKDSRILNLNSPLQEEIGWLITELGEKFPRVRAQFDSLSKN